MLMKKLTRLLPLSLVLAILGVSLTETAFGNDTVMNKPPRIGLVLAGGGAKGFAHIGVIRVLEQQQIPVHVVTGTSMGAIIGSLYASGYRADDIEGITRGINWSDVFNDKAPRENRSLRRKTDDFGFLTDYRIKFNEGKLALPVGLIQGQKLFLELADNLSQTRHIGHFDQLPIPLRVVATDIESGEAIILHDGDLATAVFASMALPGIVPPVEWNGRLLVDGGISNNVPVDQAKLLGADILIVVSFSENTLKRDELNTFFDVLNQTKSLLIKQNIKQQLALLNDHDILLTPDMGDIGTGSFDRIDDAIKIGEQVATDLLPLLHRLHMDNTNWEQHLQARYQRKQTQPTIDFVRVEHDSAISDEVIKSYIDVAIGQTLDSDSLNENISDLYGLDIFDRVSYDIVEEDGQTGVVVIAEEKQSGTDFFRFGLALDSDFDEADFQLGISYNSLAVNSLGGEFRGELDFGSDVNVELEFYQPLDRRQRFFIEPSLSFSRNRVALTPTPELPSDGLRVRTFGASLDTGYVFGNWGELRAGIARGKINAKFLNDEDQLPNFQLSDTTLNAAFSIDTVDDLSFPRRGVLANISYSSHESFAGGELSFQEIEIFTLKPWTYGRHTIVGGLRFDGTYGRDANLLSSAELGGFLSLSGFSEDELSGQYAAQALGLYYYRLNEASSFLDIPVYLGASIEAGNVYEDISDFNFNSLIWAGSIFIGLKSPIGPVYFGLGHNDESETSLYFSVGSFF